MKNKPCIYSLYLIASCQWHHQSSFATTLITAKVINFTKYCAYSFRVIWALDLIDLQTNVDRQFLWTPCRSLSAISEIAFARSPPPPDDWPPCAERDAVTSSSSPAISYFVRRSLRASFGRSDGRTDGRSVNWYSVAVPSSGSVRSRCVGYRPRRRSCAS